MTRVCGRAFDAERCFLSSGARPRAFEPFKEDLIMSKLRTRRVAADAFVYPLAAAMAALGIGCSNGASSTDGRFAADTYDENNEPLTNAVIGSPDGTTVRIGNTPPPVPIPPTSSGSGSSSGGSSGGGSSSGGSSSGGSSGGVVDSGFDDDGGPEDGGEDGGTSGGFGFWHFDDCSPTSHFLLDSSGEGANAVQALKADCVQGISNLAVEFRSPKDIVQVPDEPQFTVSNRIAVAAWVKPTTVGGDQPIVLKRLNNQTSFSLGIHDGEIQMSVVLADGTTVISQAPIEANTWTHVAGMYDGTFVFLFIDGQQFGQVYGGGNLRDVFAPLRIGATTQTQYLHGIIDEVFVSTQAIGAAQLTALACLPHSSTLSVTPSSPAAVPFDTTVNYTATATNNDVGFCQPSDYSFDFQSFDPTIITNVPSPFVTGVAPGGTATFALSVTGNDDADPGVHQIPFSIFRFDPTFESLSGELTYTLQQPTGCFVTRDEELMITSTSVVDDPVRTVPASQQDGDGGAPPSPSAGVWTFGQLMRDLAPTPDAAPAMVLQLFQTWLTDQTINGFTVAARPAMQQVLLDQWPTTSTGALDLDQAPLVLQAIINRMDVRSPSAANGGTAGEGRFVFGVNTPQAFQNFTVIIEYQLPAQTAQDVFAWANRWHALSTNPFPSEAYNAALEQITRAFAGPGVTPGNVNGSALAQLRTNEIATSIQWELRSFSLSASTGFLQEIPVDLTPDLGFNGTSSLTTFVNDNAAAISSELYTVPLDIGTTPFLGGSVFNPLVEWNAPGIDPDARFHLSLNTCNGCHGPETNTTFLQITPRLPGTEAQLSPFLTGTTVFDPNTGAARNLNELARRKDDLTNLVCNAPDGGTVPPPPPVGPPPSDGGIEAGGLDGGVFPQDSGVAFPVVATTGR
jgi:Concanavalin A-like lectin/glucanases superfamily